MSYPYDPKELEFTERSLSFNPAVPGIVAWGDLERAIRLVPGKVSFIEPHPL